MLFRAVSDLACIFLVLEDPPDAPGGEDDECKGDGDGPVDPEERGDARTTGRGGSGVSGLAGRGLPVEHAHTEDGLGEIIYRLGFGLVGEI